MTRALYEVIPRNDGWLVRVPSDSVSEFSATKEAAVRRAKELAGQYDEWTVRVLDRAGKLETEITSRVHGPE